MAVTSLGLHLVPWWEIHSERKQLWPNDLPNLTPNILTWFQWVFSYLTPLKLLKVYMTVFIEITYHSLRWRHVGVLLLGMLNSANHLQCSRHCKWFARVQVSFFIFYLSLKNPLWEYCKAFMVFTSTPWTAFNVHPDGAAFMRHWPSRL